MNADIQGKKMVSIWLDAEKLSKALEAKGFRLLIHPDGYQVLPLPPAVDYCIMPRELTAENGAKALLMGEFHEIVIELDPDGGSHQREIPVSWSTIKAIYKKAVERLAR